MIFSPIDAFKVLLAHEVDFLVIGGLAATLWGSPSVTRDLDICYARDRSNLVKLAAALVEMKATLRGAPEDVPFILDERTLAMGDNFTFNTVFGALDCLGHPAGVGGFDEMKASAVSVDLDDVSVEVASLDDLIRMKRAAGRPKDLAEMEILGALREELGSKDSGSRSGRSVRPEPGA